MIPIARLNGTRLTAAQAAVLAEVLSRDLPGVHGRTSQGNLELTKAESEAVADICIDEFCASGLLASDEPNERGLVLESLIDIAMRRVLNDDTTS